MKSEFKIANSIPDGLLPRLNTLPFSFSLKKHQTLKHKDDISVLVEKPYKCTDCNASFQTKIERRRHRGLVHPDLELPYICEVCQKRFLYPKLLREHQKHQHQSYRYFFNTPRYITYISTYILHILVFKLFTTLKIYSLLVANNVTNPLKNGQFYVSISQVNTARRSSNVIFAPKSLKVDLIFAHINPLIKMSERFFAANIQCVNGGTHLKRI